MQYRGIECDYQMRYRGIGGSFFNFLEKLLRKSRSNELGHPWGHVVIGSPDSDENHNLFKGIIDTIVIIIKLILWNTCSLFKIARHKSSTSSPYLTIITTNDSDSDFDGDNRYDKLWCPNSCIFCSLSISHSCLLPSSYDRFALLSINDNDDEDDDDEDDDNDNDNDACR